MKKLLFCCLPLLLLAACKQPSPKDTARQFVKATYLLDFETAAGLSTSDTKKSVTSNNVAVVENNIEQRNRGFAANNFMLDSLTEQIKGDAATVESGGIKLNMVKENKEWKVMASESLLDDIVNRTEKAEALKARWNYLYTNYGIRNKAIKDYVEYQVNRGSITPEGQALLQLIANTSLEKNFSRSELTSYLDQQKQIGLMADKVIVPSFSANADMSLNMAIRINEAQRNVDAAKIDYNEELKKTLHPLYIPAQ